MQKKEDILKGAADANKVFLETVSLERLLAIGKETMSDDEAMVKASDYDIFYEKYFSKDLDIFLLEELKYAGEIAQNVEMLMFCRGHIDMINKLKNFFIQQKSLSLSRFDREEKQDGLL